MSQDLLLGDVGGSGSRWALLSNDALTWSAGDLPGANPATGSMDDLGQALQERSPVMGSPGLVMVYGAGCGTRKRGERVRMLLGKVFKEADIVVADDLLGAARALFGDRGGHALILGTGMNAGHFDGRKIDHRIRSIGYILGDEGSGADIGRCLFRDALRGDMPRHVEEALFGGDGLDPSAVVETIHRSASTAMALAGPVKHLGQVREDPYVHQLLRERFGAMALQVGRELGAGTFRAVGSVAWAFASELRDAFQEHGSMLDTVVRDPMDGLIAYHRTHPMSPPNSAAPQD
ncbi:MAG: hypothetical protein H6595_03860 [Flavobacteriales bacterium]|nr:hypothetical protein [Flavobacteriales bacterium]MCB9166596.1 hypothetical protein [Flavobacteriales bacterium]